MTTVITQQHELKKIELGKRVGFTDIDDVKIIVIEMKHHKHKLTPEQVRRLRKDLEAGCCTIM